MPLLFPYNTVGAPSIPIKQINNNKISTADMGMPFKPDTMTQGSDFSNGRAIYNKKALGGPGWYSASQVIERKKAVAIGKSSTGATLPPGAPNAFAFRDKNDVKDGLRRCRAGGCVAPKKVGANYN
jgi:hypothetical protein